MSSITLTCTLQSLFPRSQIHAHFGLNLLNIYIFSSKEANFFLNNVQEPKMVPSARFEPSGRHYQCATTFDVSEYFSGKLQLVCFRSVLHCKRRNTHCTLSLFC